MATKKYRTLKSGHRWTEDGTRAELVSVKGEVAQLTEEQFNGAPAGTFELMPGEEGYVNPASIPEPDPRGSPSDQAERAGSDAARKEAEAKREKAAHDRAFDPVGAGLTDDPGDRIAKATKPTGSIGPDGTKVKPPRP